MVTNTEISLQVWKVPKEQIPKESKPSFPKDDRRVIWNMRPVLPGDVPGLWFDNETGTVSTGSRSYGRFEVLDDESFGDGIVARRPMDLVQKIDFEFEGKPWHTVIDHRKACGWRTLGIEAILEIEFADAGEKWWFVYAMHSSGQHLWQQMTPTTEYVLGLETMYQFPRFWGLVLQAVVTAFMYLGVTAAAAFVVMKIL